MNVMISWTRLVVVLSASIVNSMGNLSTVTLHPPSLQRPQFLFLTPQSKGLKRGGIVHIRHQTTHWPILLSYPMSLMTLSTKLTGVLSQFNEGKGRGRRKVTRLRKRVLLPRRSLPKIKHQRRSHHLLRARVQSVVTGRGRGLLRSLCQFLALILGESNMFLFCICLVLCMSCAKCPSHLPFFHVSVGWIFIQTYKFLCCYFSCFCW